MTVSGSSFLPRCLLVAMCWAHRSLQPQGRSLSRARRLRLRVPERSTDRDAGQEAADGRQRDEGGLAVREQAGAELPYAPGVWWEPVWPLEHNLKPTTVPAKASKQPHAPLYPFHLGVDVAGAPRPRQRRSRGRLRRLLRQPLHAKHAQQCRRVFLCDFRHSVGETPQRIIAHVSARFSWSEATS